jgi:thiol-disulfide isomerase/thioredoxin
LPRIRNPRRTGAIAAVAALALAAGLYLALTLRTAPVDRGTLSALTLAQFPTLAGNSAKIAGWRGKVMVVNFWASWCPPCREEIPGLVRAQAKYAVNGVQIVGIAVDSAAKSREAAAELGIDYPVLIAGLETVDLLRRLGNRAGGLPYTVILDRQGELVATHLGVLTEPQLDRLLAPLLVTPPPK